MLNPNLFSPYKIDENKESIKKSLYRIIGEMEDIVFLRSSSYPPHPLCPRCFVDADSKDLGERVEKATDFLIKRIKELYETKWGGRWIREVTVYLHPYKEPDGLRGVSGCVTFFTDRIVVQSSYGCGRCRELGGDEFLIKNSRIEAKVPKKEKCYFLDRKSLEFWLYEIPEEMQEKQTLTTEEIRRIVSCYRNLYDLLSPDFPITVEWNWENKSYFHLNTIDFYSKPQSVFPEVEFVGKIFEVKVIGSLKRIEEVKRENAIYIPPELPKDKAYTILSNLPKGSVVLVKSDVGHIALTAINQGKIPIVMRGVVKDGSKIKVIRTPTGLEGEEYEVH